MTNDLLNMGPCIDSILGIRDDLGLNKKDVFIRTRTWSGDAPGDGTSADTEEQILPSPLIVEVAHNIRIMESGYVKQGDLILKGISKNIYQEETAINCFSTSSKVEKFYRIGTRLYNVIYVKENYLTWDVQIRATTMVVTDAE